MSGTVKINILMESMLVSDTVVWINLKFCSWSEATRRQFDTARCGYQRAEGPTHEVWAQVYCRILYQESKGHLLCDVSMLRLYTSLLLQLSITRTCSTGWGMRGDRDRDRDLRWSTKQALVTLGEADVAEQWAAYLVLITNEMGWGFWMQ